MFICPHCQNSLLSDDSSWKCQQGHSYDVGKSGDVNLLLPQQKRSLSPGDSKEMVVARRDFLSSRIYAPIAEKIVSMIIGLDICEKPVIVDAGCGEGYYLRAIQSAQLCKNATYIGWDISKYAVQSAAKYSTNSLFVTASNAHIPLESCSVDVLLSMFGFEVSSEFHRVLKHQTGKKSYVITADVGEYHLIELRKIIYPTIKKYTMKPSLDDSIFNNLQEETISYQTTLNKENIKQLLIMTPHFYKAKAEQVAKIMQLDSLSITIDVLLRLYTTKQ